MPFAVHVIRGRDFVRLDATGHIDMASSRALLSDAIWVCVRSKVGRVLIDVREATSTEITVAQIGLLVDVCRQIAPADDVHRIAILNRPIDDYDRAELLAAAARQEGWNIQAFRNFEDAFLWLSE
jgi:hypothetical protein